mgnify:CR=1 FL=1
MSQIKDIKLAPSGADKIAWVASYMPILNSVKEEFERRNFGNYCVFKFEILVRE